MDSQPKDARVRVRISNAAMERLNRIAKARNLDVFDYLRGVLENHEDDYIAYHAYNASRHATLAALVMMVYLQVTTNKNFNPDVLKDVGKHVFGIVGEGPARPQWVGGSAPASGDDFTEALIDMYSRFIADRFPEMRPTA